MSFQVTRCENQVVLEEAREKCEIKKNTYSTDFVNFGSLDWGDG